MAQSSNSSSLLDISGLETLAGSRVGIVYTEWNEKIINELIAGADKIFSRLNITTHKISVPGSFELPFACKQLFEYTFEKPDAAVEAIIAFGTVIRGGTPHFEYVCKAVTEGITRLNLMLPIPVIFGVLTLDNEQQAWERLGGIHGHKGEEAAITALKMIKNGRAYHS